MRELNVNELKYAARELKAGDRVKLSGEVYTARDAAHLKIFELLDAGKEPPFEIKNAVIYYTGPTPGREGMPVGACGPTTSGRMDIFTPRLLDMGLAAMIGKGERSPEVNRAIVRNGSVYFCAVGGAGALIARHVTEAEETAFFELGCESVKKLTIKDLPVIVAVDRAGGDIFTEGRKKYALV
ncbi:MAG: FumA C-terminus/TtdB family hydratase beta subunit [Oscillospiraceae bacterium]|nr:FumA C-terminus/TtdB family hydratase beta subunit [Oscillospiraceae bacterium]